MKKKETLFGLSLQELRQQIILLTAEQKILAHDLFFAELSQVAGVKIHSEKTIYKLLHRQWESLSENGLLSQLKKLREQLVSLEKTVSLPDPTVLLSEEEAASYLGFSNKKSLSTLRKSGLGPPSRRLSGGRQVVYSLSDMNFFLLHGTANPSPLPPNPFPFSTFRANSRKNWRRNGTRFKKNSWHFSPTIRPTKPFFSGGRPQKTEDTGEPKFFRKS